MNQPGYLKAWVIFTVVAIVGGVIAGGFAGGVAGFLLAFITEEDADIVERNKSYFQLVGAVVGLAVSFVTYRWSVSRFILPQLGANEPNTRFDDVSG